MVAEFQKQDSETLVTNVDQLIYRILNNIKGDDFGKQVIDVDVLCDLLEDFAGRDYIIDTKLKNEMPLSSEDREYIREILNKRAS